MKINKKVLILTIVGVALLSFLAGGFAQASTDVVSRLLMEARVDMEEVGRVKTDQLIDKIDVMIEQRTEELVDPLSQAEVDRIEIALQAYFNTRYENIAEENKDEIAPQLKDMMSDITISYVNEINEAFDNR